MKLSIFFLVLTGEISSEDMSQAQMEKMQTALSKILPKTSPQKYQDCYDNILKFFKDHFEIN